MGDEKQAATATKSAPVRNWTEEEKDVVWEEAVAAKADGLPLTEAFRRCAKLLPHRSEAAIGMLYYNVLRKERDEPSTPPRQTRTELHVNPTLLEAFQGLPEYMQELQKKLSHLEEQVKKPDALAILRSIGQIAADLGSDGEQEALTKKLQEENAALRENNSRLADDLRKLREAYDDALGIYDMFTNMASISQIMSLGDFKQQMKTTLDKWGNVLDITLARSI
ncbi:MAG: hypothetical protein M0R49_04600 [Limnochordia bacterium]|nr:hypothetical protein [Limnochordia bacterium]